MSFEATGMVVH